MIWFDPRRRTAMLLALLVLITAGGLAAAAIATAAAMHTGTASMADAYTYDSSDWSTTPAADLRTDAQIARPLPRAPLGAVGLVSGCCVAAKAGEGAISRGTRFVTTPRGTTFDIPEGWAAREAENGKGIVYQRPGAPGNADSIRIMEPTPDYPNGYFRYYNSEGRGQPLDVNGKPGPPGGTHHHEDFTGPLRGWPGG